MRAVLILCLVCSTACGSERTPEPAPSPVTTPDPVAPPEPAPEAVPESPPEPSPQRQQSMAAAEAYRALVGAYNRRDREAYFAAFADELRCFYGRPSVSRATVEQQRWREGAEGFLAVAKLTLLKQTADEVYFLDRGFWLERSGGRQVIHEKVVVLRRQGSVWRVVVETNRDGMSCVGQPIELAAHGSEAFVACRTAHRACLAACRDTGCREACIDTALECIGVRHGRPPAITPSGPALSSVGDVRRFVGLALAHDIEGWGGDVEGVEATADDSDSEWLRATYARLGSPRIRAAPGDTAGACGQSLLTHDLAVDLTRIDLGETRCTPTRDRCVVLLEARRWSEPTRHYALHLLFDGDALRVSLLEGPSDIALVPDAELGRFADRHPAAWSTACAPTIEALADDRVGEDFWEVETGVAIERPDGEIDEIEITRLCGEAARRAVQALGDDWLCGARACGPPQMCGNWCEALSFEGDRVLSHGEGMDPVDGLSPAQARALRAQVACGASTSRTYDQIEAIGE